MPRDDGALAVTD